MVLRLLKNTFVSQNIGSVYFCSCTQAPTSSYHYHARQEEITHFPQAMLFEKAGCGKDYEAEKMTKIKFVTGFD